MCVLLDDAQAQGPYLRPSIDVVESANSPEYIDKLFFCGFLQSNELKQASSGLWMYWKVLSGPGCGAKHTTGCVIFVL